MWKEISEERFHDFLTMVPPAVWETKGFLFGEAHGAKVCSVSRKEMVTYVPFVNAFGRYFYEGEPMTVAEFDAFRIHHIQPPPKAP